MLLFSYYLAIIIIITILANRAVEVQLYRVYPIDAHTVALTG